MIDIEDLGFDLVTGKKVESESVVGLQCSISKSGIIELSRREDAATALETAWLPLVRRKKGNVKHNALNDRLYNLDLSDPNWKVLVLWTKDPGKVADYLEIVDQATNMCLLDMWPVIYAVVTLNGICTELEPRVPRDALEGFERLANLLAAKHSAEPSDCVYAKVGDPFIQYRYRDKVYNTWEALGPVYECLKNLGFRSAHCGPLDLRGKWGNAIQIAMQETKVQLLPFNWDAPIGAEEDDIYYALTEMLQTAAAFDINLKTCGASKHIGITAPGARKLREGICVSLPSINRLLTRSGQKPLRPQKLQRPKGERVCNCQNSLDIGVKVKRNAKEGRRACHGCVYCFVRSQNA